MTTKKNAAAETPAAAKSESEKKAEHAPEKLPNAAGRKANVAVPGRAVSAHVAAVLPPELLALRAWLVWRWETGTGSTPRKVPHYHGGGRRTGSQGSPSDLRRLGTFAQAAQVADGDSTAFLGLAMLPEHGITAFDFDSKADTVNPLYEAEVRALLPDCYIERSPSGRGFRAFVRGQLHLSKGARGIEAFSTSQFVTLTGNALDGVPSKLGVLTDDLRQRIVSMAKKTAEATRHDAPRPPKPPLGIDLADAKTLIYSLPSDWYEDRPLWLKVGMVLHHEFAGSNEALELWDEWSQQSMLNYTNADDSQGCAGQWTTFGRPDRLATIGSLVRHAAQVPQRVRNALAAAEFAPVPLLAHEPEADDDDLASFALPQMPDAALYGVLREIVDAATAKSEATRPGVAATTLVHFAARFGKALGIDIGDEKRTLPLYVLLVGPTGRGRKGTSSEFAKQLFEDVDRLLTLGWGDDTLAPKNPSVPPLQSKGGVSSGQGLIELVRDDIAYFHRGVERFVPGVEDKRWLLDLSEFAQVFSVSAQESSTLSMVLRDAFDARKLQSPSRNNPLEATGAHFAVLGHITMSEFRRRTIGDKRSTETQNGLLNRFAVMYSVRDRIVAHPEPVPDKVRRSFAARIANNVHSVFGMRYSDHRSYRTVVLRLTDEARGRWSAAYPELTQQSYDTEIVYEMMARRELITLNLAALLAALNGEDRIGIEPLEAALAWGSYMVDTNVRVFTTLAERRAAVQLRGWVERLRARLERAPDRTMELREVRAAFNKTAFVPAAQDAAVRAMVEASPPQLAIEGRRLRLLDVGHVG